MVQCITSTRMTLRADILRQGSGSTVSLSDQGSHEVYQNPRTGAIQRRWVPVLNEDDSTFTIECDVIAIVDGGIRVAGTTERFDKIYDNIDFVQMKFPAKYKLSKRDRVTNVRNKRGDIIWEEEELDAINGIYPATVFDILGVSPIKGPFGDHIENHALMARADLNAS